MAEWDEMKKLYRGPYIDAFCQDWFQLTDRRRTPSDGNTSHDPLGSGELKIVCFTPNRPLENVATRNIFWVICADFFFWLPEIVTGSSDIVPEFTFGNGLHF